MFNVVDYRARKVNKEKVIPYDSIKPFVALEDISEDWIDKDMTSIDFSFKYKDLGERFSREEAELVNPIESSKDYILLWRCLLFQLNAYSNPLAEDDDLIVDERRVINRLVLEAFLKKHINESSRILVQTDKAPILTSLTLVENLILSIIGSNNKIIKNGFERNDNKEKPKKVKITKRNFLIFLKWIYEYEIDVTVHDLITMYSENTIKGLFLTDLVVDAHGIFDSFHEDPMYHFKGDVGFNKRSSNKGIPISILYRYLSENLSIYGFEMFRGLSGLLKKGLINYEKGLLVIKKEVDFTSGKLIINIEDYINNGQISDAVKVFNEITKEFPTTCPFCKKGKLYFTKGAVCNKCKKYIKKGYWGTNNFTPAQLSLLARVGRVFHFKNNKPIILYLKESNEMEYKVTAISDKYDKNF